MSRVGGSASLRVELDLVEAFVDRRHSLLSRGRLTYPLDRRRWVESLYRGEFKLVRCLSTAENLLQYNTLMTCIHQGKGGGGVGGALTSATVVQGP